MNLSFVISRRKFLPGHLFLLLGMCFFQHLPVTGRVSGKEESRSLHRGRLTKNRALFVSRGCAGTKDNVQDSPKALSS